MPDLRKMKADEFARRLKIDGDIPDKRFAFFLGAGCSVSSGISGAVSLVKDRWLPRLQELCAPGCKDFDAWVKEEFPNYAADNPAMIYGPVMEKLFLNAEDRQQEIERLCEGKNPGFGYTVLAKLVARAGGNFNVVVTTNFDDLVSDALYLFTSTRPLVIGHESLAGFIRPTRTRPLVVKLHGDAHLVPLNTSDETRCLQKEVEDRVSGLLDDRGLIVMGYGGNDQSIATMLKALPRDALPLGIYWVSGIEPQGILRGWLEERKAIWVEQLDFDEMMLLIQAAFELPQPDPKLFDAVLQNYFETYKKLSERIHAAPAKAEDGTLKSALERADADLSGWQSVAMAANKLEKSDPEKAQKIYIDGLERFPTSAPLLGGYAIFLHKIRKDYDKAEQFYLRAIQADPNRTANIGNYAAFLHEIRKDGDKAEQFYLRAIEADPNYAIVLGNYA
ncbi:MAG: SIR2 family protein, partial [Anaerolineales bacterium]